MDSGVVEYILRARDESAATINKATGNIASLSGAFRSLSQGAGAFGLAITAATAAVGGILSAGKAISDTVEQLDRLSARTGVSIERLQAIQEVVKQGGGDSEAVTAALGFLNRAIAQNDPLLARLGIRTRDTYAAFTQLAAILSTSSDAAARTEVAFRLLGKGSGDLLGNISDVATQVEAMRTSMAKSGGLITGQSAESARKLDKQLDQLGATWHNLVISFQTLAVPAATAIAGLFDGILKLAISFAASVRELAIGPLEELAKAAKDLHVSDQGDHLAQIEQAKAEARKTGGNVQVGLPTVEGVTVTAKRRTDPLQTALASEREAAKQREERLKELERDLDVGRAKAIEYLKVLDDIEEGSKRVKTVEALRSAGVDLITPDTKKLEALAGPPPVVQPRLAAGATLGPQQQNLGLGPLRPAEFDFEAHERQVKKLIDSASKLSGAYALAAGQWRQSVEQMTSDAAILDDAFGTVYDGLNAGFATVFANLTNKAQTFSSAMKSLFNSMVQEILSSLARLAAAKLFQFLLSLIPGGQPAATIVGAASAGAGSIKLPGSVTPHVPQLPDVGSLAPTRGVSALAAQNERNVERVTSRASVAERQTTPNLTALQNALARVVNSSLPALTRLTTNRLSLDRLAALRAPGLDRSVSRVSGLDRVMKPITPGFDRLAASRDRGKITINISAMNEKDIANELRDPRGQLRQALEAAGLAVAF